MIASVKNLVRLIRFLCIYIFTIKTNTQLVKNIHTISYREFVPRGGRGVGAAVQTCQNILLSNKYKKYALKYTYFIDNKYFQDWKSRIADLWGAVFFAVEQTKHERNTVYITHDYGTAFGLALLKKNTYLYGIFRVPELKKK